MSTDKPGVAIAWIATRAGYSGRLCLRPELRILQRLAQRHKRRQVDDFGLIRKRRGREFLGYGIGIGQGVVNSEPGSNSSFVVVKRSVG